MTTCAEPRRVRVYRATQSSPAKAAPASTRPAKTPVANTAEPVTMTGANLSFPMAPPNDENPYP